uniref:Ovule protein n=1 Tax=Globodera pallida TaxID=36090 RepID=A0A183CRN0_GLOPA
NFIFYFVVLRLISFYSTLSNQTWKANLFNCPTKFYQLKRTL